MVTQSAMPPFEEYVELIRPLWETRSLTNMGDYHRRLENELENMLGRETSLTANGHMALELAIQSMNFPRGSEVITTPYTFISTTHAIIRNGLKPVFCDVDDDFTIDAEKIETLVTEKTVAILPVHVYGNICDVEKIEEIAYKYGLKVIYDAAHAFGEVYKGRSIARYGDTSIFSFHATKIFHTIEGGCVCCSDHGQYETIYNLKNFGIRSEELTVQVGTNAKMNEFQAAMGLCNLRHIKEEIEKRGRVIAVYRTLLEGRGGITLNTAKREVESNNAYFPVLFEDITVRDCVYHALREKNIFSRKYFYPITADAACFKNRYREAALSRARDFSNRVLLLPLYSDIGEENVERIVAIIRTSLAGGV